jgi:predicted alpha/beta superfamily hydrolase
MRKRASIAVVSLLLSAASGSAAAQSVPAPASAETVELKSEVFENRRSIRVLLPAGYNDPANRNRRYPVIYLNDGFAVFKSGAWNAPEIVRRLETEGRIRPILLVGVDNGATAENGSDDQRTREYLPYADPKNEPDVLEPRGSSYPDFLVREVMPAVASRYRTLPGRENVGVGGASLGGLAALFTVMHRPDVFGRLLIESTPLFLADFAAIHDARNARDWPSRISIGVGTKETGDETLASGAGPAMERLRSVIRERSPGSEVRLLVEPGGTHDSASWRRRLPAALEFLWPPVSSRR